MGGKQVWLAKCEEAVWLECRIVSARTEKGAPRQVAETLRVCLGRGHPAWLAKGATGGFEHEGVKSALKNRQLCVNRRSGRCWGLGDCLGVAVTA